jgi:peptidoglycan hydrolase-like protein with peptidoglycan-binding domain
MKITRYLLISGLAAAVGAAAACERRTSEDRGRTPSSTAASPSSSEDKAASPPAGSSDKQPVSGSALYYVTDSGTRKELTDTATVTDVQKRLAREGLYSGEADGHASPELTSALRRFQARNGLPDTAVIDHATANKLGLDWDAMAKPSAIEKGANEVRDTTNKAEKGAHDVGKDIQKGAEKLEHEVTK